MKTHPLTALFRAFLILTVFCLAGQPAARAESNLDFTLVNDTGYEIKEVHMCEYGAKTWSQDILGSQRSLKVGAQMPLKFPKGDRQTHWDLKIVWNNGSSRQFMNIDLSEIDELTLHYRESDRRAWFTVR